MSCLLAFGYCKSDDELVTSIEMGMGASWCFLFSLFLDRLLFPSKYIYLPALSLSLQCHNAVSLLVFVNQGWVVGTPSPILLRHPFLVWLSWTQQVYLTKKEQTSTSHVFGDLLGVLE